MYVPRATVKVIVIGSFISGCSVQPMEYHSNESLEGPGIFEDGLFTSNDNERVDETGPVGSSPQRGTSRINAETVNEIVKHNAQLLREFEQYMKFKNLSKVSEQYERFREWLTWRLEHKSELPK